jgi:dTDP-4-amino-4,6-dideoxygalactose transaminase
MLRYLPPTATPLPLTTLWRAGIAAMKADSTEQFRLALAGYLGAPHCYLASSGRTALYLLLKSLLESADHPARKEVALPAYTCPALAKVALDLNLIVRLVDISPYTLAFDPESLEAQVSERTLAIICVHPFGIPQPLADAQRLARGAGAWVVEDAAQSMGARLNGCQAGTVGDFGLFSLGPGKPLSTGGGGVVCTRDEGHAEHLARVWESLPGVSPIASIWALLRLALFTLAFHPTIWGFAARAGAQRVGESEASWGYGLRGLSATQAAVGLALLPRLDAANAQRRRHAEELMVYLHATDDIYTLSPRLDGSCVEPTTPIYLRLPVMATSKALRERLFWQLQRAGVGAGRMYGKTIAGYFPHLASVAYPGAQTVADCLLTLPTHHYLTADDIERTGTILSRSYCPLDDDPA